MDEQIQTLMLQSLFDDIITFSKCTTEDQKTTILQSLTNFINTIQDVLNYAVKWSVYIKLNNTGIYNVLYLILQSYPHVIKRRIDELKLLNDNSPFKQLKSEIYSFYRIGMLWTLQVIIYLYTFYVSMIDKKAFEVSKSIFIYTLGYTSNPLNALDELTKEYKLPIYDSFRYQTIEKYVQWEMSFKNLLEKFVSKCGTNTVTAQDAVHLMENLITFRFSFLSGKEFNLFCFEDFPIEHSIRSEIMFINSLRTIQTNSKIAEIVISECFTSLKQNATSFRDIQTNDKFFLLLYEQTKKNDLFFEYFNFFTRIYRGFEKETEDKELGEFFERSQKVYTEMVEAKQLNETNHLKAKIMEYDHLLKLFTLVNHPRSRLYNLHFQIKVVLEKIYLDLVSSSENQRTKVLLFSVSFYFMLFNKLAKYYHGTCDEMQRTEELIGELFQFFSGSKHSLASTIKRDIIQKVLTIKYLCEIIVYRFRYSPTSEKTMNYLTSLGGFSALSDLSQKIIKILYSTKKNEILIFPLAKMYRDIFRCVLKQLEELTQHHLLKYIYDDMSINLLLQNAMKYDEGKKTLRLSIIMNFQCLYSSLCLSISQMKETKRIVFILSSQHWFYIMDALLKWYLDPSHLIKVEHIQYSHLLIQYFIRSEVIKTPRSSNSYFFCKLLADVDRCCEIFRINNPSNEQFQTAFSESMNLSYDFFKVTSMISQTPKQPELSPALLKYFSFINANILLKQLIEELQKGNDVTELIQHIMVVIKGYSHFMVSVLTFGVLENEYPEILGPFNDFIELIQTNKINEAIELGNYILFVLFDRISIEEMFFELILFSKNKKNSNDDVEYVLNYFVDYFLLQEHLYPSLSSSVFNSSRHIADTLKKNVYTKNSTNITNVVNVLSIYIPFTSLVSKLIAIFKKYQKINKTNTLHIQELNVWVELTLDITKIYSSQKTSYDALLHMSHTIILNLYYHPYGSLCLTDPLSNVIQVLECLIKKDQFIIPQTIMKLLGVFVSCRRIEKVTDNVTNISRIKFLVKTHLKQILNIFDNVSWDDSKILTLRTSIIKLGDNISELSTNYDFDIWISKFQELFIDFIGNYLPITMYIEYFKALMAKLSFNIILCFQFKNDMDQYFFMIYNFMFLTEKMQDLIFIGKKIYQYASDFSQIGNKTFLKINKINNFNGVMKKIKDQLEIVYGVLKPENLEDVITSFTRENNTKKQINTVLNKTQTINENISGDYEKSFEDSQNGDCSDLSISEDDESNNEIVEDINKHLHNIFMLLQSIEIDKKSRPKTKIIRLLTSVAEDFFNTADGLNDKIIIKDVQLKSEKLLMDAVCVKNLLHNLVELVMTIRSVICNDKEKWLGILNYIELYDNYQQMISKIISTMYLFLESFKKLNVKRSNETKQILNQMVSGLIYFFITPFINIEIHDSTYANSFIYNQSRKEHILENSHIALLCSEFNSISKKNGTLNDILNEMEDVDEFIEFIGIKYEVVESLQNLKNEEEVLLSKYIQERVTILLNNTKPSFFFLAHVGVRAIESSKSLTVQLKSNPMIYSSCKRESKCLLSYMQCLTAMIDVFVAITPETNTFSAWIKHLQQIFNERHNNISKWVSDCSKSKFNKKYFDFMICFKSEIKLLYVKDVIFIISSFVDDDKSYHDKPFVALIKKIYDFINSSPYDKSLIPEMHSIIEELKRVVLFRIKISKRSECFNLQLYSIENPNKQQMLLACKDLHSLLQSLSSFDFGNLTFRQTYANNVIESNIKTSLFDCEKRVLKNENVSKEIFQIAKEIYQEYIYQIIILIIDQAYLIRQAVNHNKNDCILFVEFYLRTILSQSKVVFDIVNLFYSGHTELFSKCIEQLEHLFKTYNSLDALDNLKIKSEMNLLPKILLTIFDQYLQFDERLLWFKNSCSESKQHSSHISLLLLEHKITNALLSGKKIESVVLKTFSETLHSFLSTIQTPVELDKIPLNICLETLPLIKSYNSLISQSPSQLHNTGYTRYEVSRNIFKIYNQFYYSSIITNDNEFEMELIRANRFVQQYVLLSQSLIIKCFIKMTTPQTVQELQIAFNKIQDILELKKEDRWTFSPNSEKRVIIAQLIDVFNKIGFRHGYMYLHCFLRKHLLNRGNIPWICFISVMEIFNTFWFGLVETEGVTRDNCVSLLKERINDVLHPSINWAFMYNAIKKLHKLTKQTTGITLQKVIDILTSSIKICVTSSFQTENNKEFSQLFDVIENLHKLLFFFEEQFSKTDVEVLKLLNNKKQLIGNCVDKLLHLDTKILLYHHYCNNNNDAFISLCKTYLNEFPFTGVLNLILKENTTFQYNGQLLSIFHQPYLSCRTYFSRFCDIINTIQIFFELKQIFELSVSDCNNMFYLFEELLEIMENLSNCITVLSAIIKNPLLDEALKKSKNIISNTPHLFFTSPKLMLNKLFKLQNMFEVCINLYGYFKSKPIYLLFKTCDQTFVQKNFFEVILHMTPLVVATCNLNKTYSIVSSKYVAQFQHLFDVAKSNQSVSPSYLLNSLYELVDSSNNLLNFLPQIFYSTFVFSLQLMRENVLVEEATHCLKDVVAIINIYFSMQHSLKKILNPFSNNYIFSEYTNRLLSEVISYNSKYSLQANEKMLYLADSYKKINTLI
ncbi:Non-specific serine/threonine protein kinase [Entamoeba marina]